MVCRWRGVAIALCAVALAGCGVVVRVAYNNGDIAMRVMAHEYFDLHGEQSDLMRAQIARFHEWHRREELPEYAALFQSAAERVAYGLKREDVAWAIAAVRGRYGMLAEQAIDEAVPVLATLQPDNYAALEKKLADNNAKLTKQYLSGDEAKRDKARVKAIVDRFEDWTGDLSGEQEEIVRAFVRASPRFVTTQLDDRKRRQREFVAVLREYRASPELKEKLRLHVVNWESSRGAEYARLAREREDQMIQLILDIDRSLTPKQRAHAVGKLEAYAEDCRVLAGVGRAKQPGQRAAFEATR